jgi:hypothetical protein
MAACDCSETGVRAAEQVPQQLSPQQAKRLEETTSDASVLSAVFARNVSLSEDDLKNADTFDVSVSSCRSIVKLIPVCILQNMVRLLSSCTKLRWDFIDCDDSLVCRLVDQGHWQSLASYQGMQTLHQGKWYHLYSSSPQLVQV